MNLITVIACHNTDCIRAERLIDQIFALNHKQQKGHAVILFGASTPQENRDKVRISAEVTFKSVALLYQIPSKIEVQDKASIVGNAMIQAATHIHRSYKSPWLWLEPDALPLKSGWQEKIEETYNSQPMRYINSHMKQIDKDGNEIFSISRMGVYPVDAIKDFENAAKEKMGLEYYCVSMSAKCRLFQNLEVKSADDESKLRPDAVLAHHDKMAVLVDKIVEDNLKPKNQKPTVTATVKTQNNKSPVTATA